MRARARAAASGSPSTSRRPASARSRPRTSRRAPTAASPSTPAPRRWGRGSRPCSRRSWARPSACPPTASTCATPTPSHVESGVGTYGSRGTVTAGNAANMAAAKLIAEARSRAAAQPGPCRRPRSATPRARSRRAAGASRSPSSPRSERLAAGASFNVPKITYAGCAVGVIADVDAETGAVRLDRVVVGADVGRAVNPALVDAQLVGGVAFGIGNTLHETLEYDGGGQLRSGTLMDYALPYAADVPPVDGFYQEVRGDDQSARPARARRMRQPRPGRRHRQCRVRRAARPRRRHHRRCP